MASRTRPSREMTSQIGGLCWGPRGPQIRTLQDLRLQRFYPPLDPLDRISGLQGSRRQGMNTLPQRLIAEFDVGDLRGQSGFLLAHPRQLVSYGQDLFGDHTSEPLLRLAHHPP